AEAARRLGVSAKALRLYEQRGLIAPARSAAGWRAYGPDEMVRGREIAALRTLGLSLAQVGRVLDGDGKDLEPALATHQAALEERIGGLAAAVARVRELRAGLLQGRIPDAGELTRLVRPAARIAVAFDLPWPWGGERFELSDPRALTYVVGPLGSGKTRFARRLAETLPGAAFLGMERTAAGPVPRARLDATIAWLAEDGATVSHALVALVAGLEAEGPAALVVDMVEHGLDHATQEAVIAHLRRRGPEARPLFLLTRSTAILDLAAVGPDEAIILCPANHSPPSRVAACPGAPGYEAVATCLASPDVRARTEGVVAWRPPVAAS
ncbi:MAG: MerR family transcriptional regulator, partial [Alphaproteobacteria bacterium]